MEKRWVASSETPSIPPGKVYRPQESQVIEFISAGHLDHIRQTTDTTVGSRPISERAPLELLKKSQRETKLHKTRHCSSATKRTAVRTNRGDFQEQGYLSANATMASLPTIEPQNSVANVRNMTRPIDTDTATEVFYLVAPAAETEMAIDDYLPESFKHALMAPSALIVDDMSSLSRTESLRSQEDSSSVYREDLMKIVCDVGIQTDWVLLDEAGY